VKECNLPTIQALAYFTEVFAQSSEIPARLDAAQMIAQQKKNSSR
jgi:hypothetical protein